MSQPPPVDDELAFVQSSLGTDLDVLLVFNLLRTQSHLAPFLDADLREWQLTPAQLNMLLVLRAAGPQGRLMGELGQELVVTKSNVTGLVDRLEQQGLVRRLKQRDRRATAVQLTAEGEAVLDRLIPPYAKLLGELTECLEPAEKETLIRLLTKLRRTLRQRTGGRR